MQVYDLPITHNRLKSREDVELALLHILSPCSKALALSNTGLFISNASTHYSDRVGLFEGWSRLLWGVAPLRKGGGSWEGEKQHFQGLINGPDPNHEHYWGDCHDKDQRMVEMAAIAYTLILDRKDYWDNLTKEQKHNLRVWLESINGKDMPMNNWRFFRILVNFAFLYLEEEYDRAQLESDIEFIEGLYVSDGWYRDNVPFDNYNTFALQFYGIFLYRYIKDYYPLFARHIRERAFLYAKQNVHYLLEDGQVIPYGRSLTYRFALVSFYSACAFAGFEVLKWGELKGIILRNLRWWISKPIFDRDGFLTIGYAYPNPMMSERYNGQGSPYWSLKTFIILALGKDHPFWQSEELPLPHLEKEFSLSVPHMIIQRTADDAVILNGGQYPVSEISHAAEKYSKFAYSSQFGFSVSISSWGFDKTGCDSMLFVSRNDGYWFPRRKCTASNHNGYVKSIWKPFNEVDITTYLFPAGNFHVRLHKIETDINITTKEGGFAIPRYKGFELERVPCISNSGNCVLVELPWAASYISDINGTGISDIIIPSSNLNLMSPCTVVPYITRTHMANTTSWIITLVGASLDSNNLKNVPDIFFDTETLELSISIRKYQLT